jgi:hypothetical protein
MRSVRNLAIIAVTAVGILAGQSMAMAASPPSSSATVAAVVSTPAVSLVAGSATVVGGSPVTATVTPTCAAGNFTVTPPRLFITSRSTFGLRYGSISIVPGCTGSGTVTSSPAGISCNMGAVVVGTARGVCSAFFPVGTVVKFTANAAANSTFQGFLGTPYCLDPSNVVATSFISITCQPVFSLN